MSTALTALIAALVTGLFGLTDSSKSDEGPKPSPSGSTQPAQPSPQESRPPIECEGERVNLEAPTDVGPTYDLIVTASCPPVSGEKYYLIAALADVGRPGTEHPLYCRAGRLDGKVGTQAYEQDLHKATVGSARTVYVLSVNAQEERELISNTTEGKCTMQLPDNADKVSGSIRVKRGW
ncbi:hypothetical protein AB0B01_16445 [Streptomyces sp. NPDC044571]|uniref:hypothetical protein n=1 Tax=Streptomyces sp. NPDC044571 TaxID=3155371 RepID=UPI0033FA301B